jgi:MAP3K TRAFs-binding domain
MPETIGHASAGPDSRQRCFVVMGFGIKTDLATGRKLDLDKSYRLLIKPAVEEADLECIRADEIRHSGIIDVPMYRELLTADFVVADLSTANPNALYELGIRHALRPRTTVVISENKLQYPFDLNHVLITSYTHLGDAIDYDEVVRFRKVLSEMMRAVKAAKEPDSPVYTFIKGLRAPSEKESSGDEGKPAQGGARIQAAAGNDPQPRPENPTLAVLVAQGEQAIARDQFAAAKTLFATARDAGSAESVRTGGLAHDPYIIQRLVLATYKTKQPNRVAALNEAMEILQALSPADSNDPETVGLAGAIEKRLFEEGQGADHLSQAISYYRRGYYLRNDWYNGINLAYLLNVRADSALDQDDTERIADLVWANRIRREVVELCDHELDEMRSARSDCRASRRSSNPSCGPATETSNSGALRRKQRQVSGSVYSRSSTAPGPLP